MSRASATVTIAVVPAVEASCAWVLWTQQYNPTGQVGEPPSWTVQALTSIGSTRGEFELLDLVQQQLGRAFR
jgi:hypothetical protein